MSFQLKGVAAWKPLPAGKETLRAQPAKVLDSRLIKLSGQILIRSKSPQMRCQQVKVAERMLTSHELTNLLVSDTQMQLGNAGEFNPHCHQAADNAYASCAVGNIWPHQFFVPFLESELLFFT